MNCKFAGRNEPRVIPGEHFDDCLGACDGCWPCPERHCLSCGRAHADVTCAECIAAARRDLVDIVRMCGFPLLEKVLSDGGQSDAAMLLGPAANTEAWQYRAMSAIFGRIDAAYLEDCRDEAHPLWVLGWIETEWRDAFGSELPEQQTISEAATYIGTMLHIVAATVELPGGGQAPEFDDAKRRLAACRSHLEDVLSEGDREEKGAPCVQCGRAMTRVVTDQGAQDEYRCRPCCRVVTGDQYRYAVGVAYRAHADRLTASDLLSQYGVKGGSVRGWASKGLVRKRGKDADGRQLYDVEDVLTQVSAGVA